MIRSIFPQGVELTLPIGIVCPSPRTSCIHIFYALASSHFHIQHLKNTYLLCKTKKTHWNLINNISFDCITSILKYLLDFNEFLFYTIIVNLQLEVLSFRILTKNWPTNIYQGSLKHKTTMTVWFILENIELCYEYSSHIQGYRNSPKRPTLRGL